MTQLPTPFSPAYPTFKLPETQPLPPTVEQVAANAAQEFRNRPDLWTALGESATLLYDVGAWATRQYYAGPNDPEWVSKNKAEAIRLLENVPYEFQDDILDAGSLLDAQLIRSQIDDKLKAYSRVSDAGTVGVLASLGIGVAEAALPAILTGGTSLAAFGAGGFRATSVYNAARVAQAGNRVATAAKIANQTGWVKLLAYGGISGSASALAYTAVDSLVDPTVEADDFRVAALWGAGIGAGANRLFGRSIIKNNLLRQAKVYDDLLYAADKTYLTRFGVDGIASELSRRFGMTIEDANSFLVAQRAFSGNPDLSFADVAVAGPKARLRRGQIVTESYTFNDRASVELLNDGKVIIRSLEKSANPRDFIRSIGGVIARRVIGEDNPNVSNTARVAFDDLLKGLGPTVKRRIPITVGVEAGNIPAGLTAAEVHLGSKLTPDEAMRAKASPWTPKVSAARQALTQARQEFEALYRKIRNKYNEALGDLEQVDLYENFLRLERSGDPELKALQAEARAASKKLNKLAKAASDVEERDLRHQLESVLSERRKAAKPIQDELKRLRKQFASKKKASAEERKAINDRIRALEAQETEGSASLRQAEEALADLDREYMILRRKEPYTNDEINRFTDVFLAWIRNSDTVDIPAELIPIFERAQEMMRRSYVDAMDPRIAGVTVSPELDLFFRQIYANTVSRHAAEVANDVENAIMTRLGAISRGADVPPADPPAPPTPGSKPKNFEDAPRVDVRLLGMNLAKLPFLNRAVAAMNNTIDEVRWLGNRMFWARIAPVDANGNMVVQRATIPEKLKRMRDIAESNLRRKYQKAFHQYMTGEKDLNNVSAAKRVSNHWRQTRIEQFNREVYSEIVSPNSASHEAVKEAAEAYRSHFTRMRKMGEEAGIRGFAGADQSGIYFPRLWKWELIDGFVRSDEDLKKLGMLIRESIQIPIVASVDDAAFKAGNAITMQGRDALAMYMAERLRQLARGENKNAYLDLDEVLLQILREEGTPPSVRNLAEGPYLTPRGRRRVPMDVAKQVDLGNGKTASLMDFLELDVTKATESYNRSVYGAIGEKLIVDEFREELIARGFLDIDEAAKINSWNEVVSYLRSKAGKYADKAEVEAGIEHLDEIMAGIRFEPLPASSEFTKFFSPFLGRLQKYAYLRNGFAFGLSAITEFGRVLGRSSASSMLKQMPIFREIVQAAKSGEITEEISSILLWVDQALGTGTDRLRRVTLDVVDSRINAMDPQSRIKMFRRLNNWMNQNLDPKLNNAATIFSDMTGLAPITTASQHMATLSIIQEVFDNAASPKAIYSDALLAQWGITRSEFTAIRKELLKNAKTNARGRVIDIGDGNWDKGTYGRFLDFLHRGTVSSIQDPPVRGDFAKILWSPLGRLMLQFKTFNVKGVSNFLMTSVQRKDARVFQEYMALMVLGTMTQMARKYLFQPAYKDEKERKKYWEENFSTQALISYALSGPTENYLLTSGIDSASGLFLGQSMIAPRVRYSGLGGGWFNPYSTPAGQLWEDTSNALSAPLRAMTREDRDFSMKDVHAIRSLLPANRAWGIGQVLNAIETGIGHHFELPAESAVKP